MYIIVYTHTCCHDKLVVHIKKSSPNRHSSQAAGCKDAQTHEKDGKCIEHHINKQNCSLPSNPKFFHHPSKAALNSGSDKANYHQFDGAQNVVENVQRCIGREECGPLVNRRCFAANRNKIPGIRKQRYVVDVWHHAIAQNAGSAHWCKAFSIFCIY